MKNRLLKIIHRMICIVIVLFFSLSISSPIFGEVQIGSLTIYRYISEKMEANIDNFHHNQMIPLANAEMTVWKISTSQAADQITVDEGRMNRIPESKSQVRTDRNGVAYLGNLDRGVYYIEDTSFDDWSNQTAHSLYETIDPFVISVPSLDPVSQTLIYDVEVYPKNQILGIDKFVNGSGLNDPELDDIKKAKRKPVASEKDFGWTIQATIPKDIGVSVNFFEIIAETTDDFVNQLNSISVYTVPQINTPTEHAHRFEKDIDYVISNDDILQGSFAIQFTETGKSKIQLRYTDDAIKDRYIRIKYDAILKKTAVQGVDISTGARLRYSTSEKAEMNFSRYSGSTMTDIIEMRVAVEPSVHTGQIGIKKLDREKPELELANAKFGIAATKNDALSGRFLQTSITNQKGIAEFEGLLYGIPGDQCNENTNQTSYWLVEIEAPETYQKMKEPFEINFDYHQNEQNQEYYFADVVVYNQVKKFDLPQIPHTSDEPGKPDNWIPKTGEVKSVASFLVGILCLTAAVFLFVLWKKRRMDDR